MALAHAYHCHDRCGSGYMGSGRAYSLTPRRWPGSPDLESDPRMPLGPEKNLHPRSSVVRRSRSVVRESCVSLGKRAQARPRCPRPGGEGRGVGPRELKCSSNPAWHPTVRFSEAAVQHPAAKGCEGVCQSVKQLSGEISHRTMQHPRTEARRIW